MSEQELSLKMDELKTAVLAAKAKSLTNGDNVVGAVDWTIIVALISALIPLIFKNSPDMAAVVTKILEILRGLFN